MKVMLLVALVATLAIAVSASTPLFTRSTVPAGWSKTVEASPDAKVTFTVALKQRNLDILNKWFTEVSDPTHANYQEFKSVDEISDLVSPTAADKAKVTAWLYGNGVHHRNVKNLGDALDVTTTVKHAEQLFSTKFHVFAHKKTGAKIVRQFGAYHVPSKIHSLVDMVTGLSTFPIPHLTAQVNGTSNDYGVIPQSIAAIYGVTQSDRRTLQKVRAAALSTSQGVIEFEQQNFAPTDLETFGSGVQENIQAVPASQIVGPNDATNPQDESSLDIQMVAGVNIGASNWFWLEQGSGWLYTFATHFFGTQTVPQVVSVSYGWWEGDQCADGIGSDECAQLGVDTIGYVNRVNTEFQKIGVRGVSLIVSSGDSGANGRTNGDCSIPQLRPSFPATSPYVTSVGATEFVASAYLTNPPPICSAAGLSCVSAGSEQAVSNGISGFASGGGFSNIASTPSYQAKAVSAYLNSGVALPPASYFNSTGRGHPDVSAIGHNLLTYIGGQVQPVGGTSASSPIFAAIIALLNVEQLANTGKPLGFLNPFLYQMAVDVPAAFNDITVGDNICTEQGCASTCKGYLCSKGWDPVTGLGTPNFPAMLKYVKSKKFMTGKKH